MRLGRWKWTLLIFGIILADQIVKIIVADSFSQVDSVTFIPHILSFIYVKNTGAAFSILSGKTGILGAVSILFCVVVGAYWLIKKPQSDMLKLSLSLLLAGAFGNAVDRVVRGFVVDFIELEFIKFPVFNIADIAITIGTGLLMIYLLFFDKDGREDGETDN